MRRCFLWGAVLAAAVAVPVDSDIQQLQSDADALLADAAASDGERGGEDASQGDGDMANFEKGKHNWADATIYELDRKTLKGDIVTSFDLNTARPLPWRPRPHGSRAQAARRATGEDG